MERMPVPQPTSSTTLPRKRCGLFMMAFLQSHPHNTQPPTTISIHSSDARGDDNTCIAADVRRYANAGPTSIRNGHYCSGNCIECTTTGSQLSPPMLVQIKRDKRAEPVGPRSLHILEHLLMYTCLPTNKRAGAMHSKTAGAMHSTTGGRDAQHCKSARNWHNHTCNPWFFAHL